jgi:hypothetical protein
MRVESRCPIKWNPANSVNPTNPDKKQTLSLPFCFKAGEMLVESRCPIKWNPANSVNPTNPDKKTNPGSLSDSTGIH